jgi:hypothetical protein
MLCSVRIGLQFERAHDYTTSHEIGIRNRVLDQCANIKVITVMQMMHKLAIIVSRSKACLKLLNSVKC